MRWIESDPRRGKHEVDVPVVLVAPVFEDFLQVELTDNLVRGKHGIHVSTKPEVSIDAPLIEFDLNKAVRVGTNDEVDLSPVNHNDFLYVVNNVGELLLCNTLHATIHLSRLELPC